MDPCHPRPSNCYLPGLTKHIWSPGCRLCCTCILWNSIWFVNSLPIWCHVPRPCHLHHNSKTSMVHWAMWSSVSLGSNVYVLRVKRNSCLCRTSKCHDRQRKWPQWHHLYAEWSSRWIYYHDEVSLSCLLVSVWVDPKLSSSNHPIQRPTTYRIHWIRYSLHNLHGPCLS